MLFKTCKKSERLKLMIEMVSAKSLYSFTKKKRFYQEPKHKRRLGNGL